MKKLTLKSDKLQQIVDKAKFATYKDVMHGTPQTEANQLNKLQQDSKQQQLQNQTLQQQQLQAEEDLCTHIQV